MGHRFTRCFFDLKVLIPLTKIAETLLDPYKNHENLKKLKYQQLTLDIKQSNFVPVIFSSTGARSEKTNAVAGDEDR